VGILNIKLEMYPPLSQTLSQEVVNTQVSLTSSSTCASVVVNIYHKGWERNAKMGLAVQLSGKCLLSIYKALCLTKLQDSGVSGGESQRWRESFIR